MNKEKKHKRGGVCSAFPSTPKADPLTPFVVSLISRNPNHPETLTQSSEREGRRQRPALAAAEMGWRASSAAWRRRLGERSKTERRRGAVASGDQR